MFQKHSKLIQTGIPLTPGSPGLPFEPAGPRGLYMYYHLVLKLISKTKKNTQGNRLVLLIPVNRCYPFHLF